MDLKVECFMHLINMHGNNIFVLTSLQGKCKIRHGHLIQNNIILFRQLEKKHSPPNRPIVITKCFMIRSFVTFEN